MTDKLKKLFDPTFFRFILVALSTPWWATA